MPSFLAHASVGYLVYRWHAQHPPEGCAAPAEASPGAVGAILVLSLLPDVDAAEGVVFGDFGRYHNNVTHSLLAGMMCALAVWLALRVWRPHAAARWGLLAVVCYGLHLAMDWVTAGRGLMLAWPLSADRYQAPFKLFCGLRWGDPLFSMRHVETVTNELPLALAALWLALRRSRAQGS